MFTGEIPNRSGQPEHQQQSWREPPELDRMRRTDRLLEWVCDALTASGSHHRSTSGECVQEGLQAEINPYTMPQDYGKYLTGNTRRIGDHAADQEQKQRNTRISGCMGGSRET